MHSEYLFTLSDTRCTVGFSARPCLMLDLLWQLLFLFFEDVLLPHSQLHISSHLLCPFVTILLCEYVNAVDCKAIV